MIDEINNVDLLDGLLVTMLKEEKNRLILLTSDNRIVRLQVSADEVLTNDLSKIDPVRLLRIWSNGDRFWYKNGVYHRDDGPAYECVDGTKVWCQNGQQHRDDGPAVEWVDRRKERYRDGYVIKSEFTNINEDE